ncbi:hypothetical protein HG535_0C04680 [Zygotorulaspora mrakii]|uniref:Putative lipoate-protein ligase A n=1 Tax=Zygotorulaspora mrakii TaxID=42260 RepID=A0A7H9B155_ZYGMR|nr:uncharacterized protein HG535_0C04680 [Zygotorulaspora mrakii]QLG72114.1 hypothetical protein HG535_0C04680 [Zygotorulaspora mrakii]
MLIAPQRGPLKGHLVRYGLRWIRSQVPFKLGDDSSKFTELNEMYTDMFSQNTSGKTVATQSENYKDMIDELNKETDQLFNFQSHKLHPKELEEIVKKPGRFIIQSLSKNPYYNLALENYVFNNTPSGHDKHNKFGNQRLLFYVNKDCVVIGKNQTVWKEVYLTSLAKRGYELLRRLSGGGTVVHDLGNVNYSFITSRDEFERDFFNKLIVQWLTRVKPEGPLALSQRGDIVLGDKKVSGSAFKIARGKSYHHGTMLINSNLDQFQGLLKPSNIAGITWKCNSVDSVRSNVTNVFLNSTQEFMDICSSGFKQHYGTADRNIPILLCDEEISEIDEIQDEISRLKSDKWKYLAGPKFCLSLANENCSITVEKGIITESSIPSIVGSSFLDFTKDLDSFQFIDRNLIL